MKGNIVVAITGASGSAYAVRLLEVLSAAGCDVHLTISAAARDVLRQELELSVRASNCLESVKVETVGQLVKMTDADLLKIRSFGKTSLREIKRKLADIGLSLGMTDSAEQS